VTTPATDPAGIVGTPATRRLDRATVSGLLRDYGLLIGMLLALLLFGIVKPQVLAPANLANVVEQSSELVILACGLAIVMMLRGVDLTVAQVCDTAGVIAALLLLDNQPLVIVLLAPIGFALVIGAVNGLLVAYIGVPAIIATLGMMFVVRSIELIISHGNQAAVLFTLPPAQADPFFFLGQGHIGPVPTSVVLALVIVVVLHVLTRSTSLGRYWSAVGGNVRAAFLAGVRHRLVFAVSFLISAACAAVAGITLASRAAIAQPGSFERYLVDCFVAVFLGSALIPSGKINVVGTAIGALFVGLIGNALTLIGLGVPYRYVVYGLVILLAMAVGILRRER
jgi:ribose transport system permease protein